MKFSDFIRTIRQKQHLSYKDVETNARGAISASYVHQLENEIIKPEAISVAKLRGLAKGLNIDEKKVFDAARGYNPPPEMEINDLMYEAFGGEEVDIEVLKKAVELIKLTNQKN